MKNFISKEEGTWEEVVPKPRIKNEAGEVTYPTDTPASEQDTLALQEKYLANKPKLKEGDEYKLISCGLRMDDASKVTGGIIIARVNKEYTRIQFK